MIKQTKEELENILWELYSSGIIFNKDNLKELGLPSYNSFMRKGINFTKLKQEFSLKLYEESPKVCPQCGTKIEYESRINTFCSRSCAMTNSNLNRPPDFKPGPPKGYKPKFNVKERLVELNTWPPYTKISFCSVCKKAFVRNTSRKTCGKDCRDSIVKNNRGRHKKSYMEESFSSWLDFHSILYETEVQFKNKNLNKCYYVDFLFEEFKLIIELDGSQHKHTKEKDKIRDSFLLSLGYYVLRISHKEYQDKSKTWLIKEIFKIAQ